MRLGRALHTHIDRVVSIGVLLQVHVAKFTSGRGASSETQAANHQTPMANRLAAWS